MATRLANTVISTARHNISEIYIVSDSEIALYWIKSSKKVPVFVKNQREKILTLKEQMEANGTKVNFYHVTTDHNPADAGTRGLTAEQINTHEWVRGPRWLEENPAIWPIKSIDATRGETEEIDIIVASNVQTPDETKKQESLIDLARFSKMDNALRVAARVGKTAYIWTQKANATKSLPIQLKNTFEFECTPEISASDISLAEKLLIIQEHRNIDVVALQRRYREKHVERDEQGIIRHKSRLQNAAIPHDTKSPIFIPHDSELSRLIMQKAHVENGHCGMDHTLSLVRQRFWIPLPAYVFKRYIKQCVTCKKYQGLPFGAPIMPPLPKDKVTVTRPFESTGCDFMGPFMSKTQEKIYVCLYTCLTTRAIHLEVSAKPDYRSVSQ
ncbi:hypothetical protein Y032_0221g2541 [Ancylostoma ceylanicum]|uniref:Integrase zinc-binding domain-containing protein n=1 Tax=Ancylostoma ceylanicum TaxID=53326 RepID=A0A016SIS0_9BILA|nr:hypothetical protein Y032_0221g2541 [Ancylostoma ceylanicum]